MLYLSRFGGVFIFLSFIFSIYSYFFDSKLKIISVVFIWFAIAEMIEDKNGIGFRYYSECAIESKAINFMKYDDIKEGDYYSILKSKKYKNENFNRS
jgi:hypothetical protein